MERNYGSDLNISTPEAVSFTLDVAGLGARFVAAIIDSLLLLAAAGIANMLFLTILAIVMVGLQPLARNFGSVLEGISYFILAVMGIVTFIIFWGYYIYYEYWRVGVTPGKRAAGLKTVKADGSPLGFADVAIRNLIRFVDLMPGVYMIGMISILASKRNQRLGDLAAGTVVVHVRAGAYVGRADQFGRPHQLGSCRLPLDDAEYETVLNFLYRRREFHPFRRTYLAAKLAESIAHKHGVQLGAFYNHEHFLDWLFTSDEMKVSGADQN